MIFYLIKIPFFVVWDVVAVNTEQLGKHKKYRKKLKNFKNYFYISSFFKSIFWMFEETVINRCLNWLKQDGLLIVQGSLHEVHSEQ